MSIEQDDIKVLKSLEERPFEVVNDIQHLLEESCSDDCLKCEYNYICTTSK